MPYVAVYGKYYHPQHFCVRYNYSAAFIVGIVSYDGIKHIEFAETKTIMNMVFRARLYHRRSV